MPYALPRHLPAAMLPASLLAVFLASLAGCGGGGGTDTQVSVGWSLHGTTGCANEDVLRNGIFDAAYERNGNGVLDPGIPLTVSGTEASATAELPLPTLASDFSVRRIDPPGRISRYGSGHCDSSDFGASMIEEQAYHLPFSHIFCNMNKKTVLPYGNLLRYAHSARLGRHKRPGLQEYFETGCLPDQYAKKEYCSPDTHHHHPPRTRRRTACDLV